VSVQADAVPDSTLSGTVVSVAPSSTVTSGAVSYLATVAFPQTDSRLKDGQTGRGTVITRQRLNVLSVPNSALHQQGTTSTVVLLAADASQQTVPVEIGAVGSERTEVLSGLTEGQRVVLPDGAS
jgi:HlyD family secretion protein